MSNVASFERRDDIRTFLPGIEPAEYELRAKLRALRNTAGAMIANTESDTARALAWMASDYCHAHLYAPADHQTLKEIARFANRLMLCSIQAETLGDEGIAA